MHSPLLLLMLLSRVAHASFMTPAAARAPRIAAARCARLTAVASVDAPAPPRRKVKDIGEAAIGDSAEPAAGATAGDDAPAAPAEG